MFAIVESGGKQFRVEPDGKIRVPKMIGEPGEGINLDRVLLCQDGDRVALGSPFVEGAIVNATIVSHDRGAKIRGFKFKRRKNYRRRWGHRQDYTLIQIGELAIPDKQWA